MEQHQNTSESEVGNLIYAYTRANAIADGTLVDVSETGAQVGFRIPVAMTSTVWQECVAWTAVDSERQTQQDEGGRLWDVLWLAFLAARRADGTRIAFRLYRVPRGGRGTRPTLTTLHLHIGPGDAGEPVITILLPHED